MKVLVIHGFDDYRVEPHSLRADVPLGMFTWLGTIDRSMPFSEVWYSPTVSLNEVSHILRAYAAARPAMDPEPS